MRRTGMAELEAPHPLRATARRALAWLGLALLLAGAAIGADLFGLRGTLFGSATPEPRPAARGFVAVPSSGREPVTVLRSQPWWQQVRRLSGSGPATETLAIDRDAIQWRARWTCTRGRFVVRAPSAEAPLADAQCPGRGTAQSSQPGTTELRVEAEGPWRLRAEQQVDVPLVLDPLPAMTAPGSRTVATGRLYRVDETAQGRATLYRLADGGYALRLSEFYVTPNVDLELRLSPLRSPKTTKEILATPSVLVAPLPITTGSLNFRIPRTVDPMRYRSLVVWCPPTRNAYGAAALTQAR